MSYRLLLLRQIIYNFKNYNLQELVYLKNKKNVHLEISFFFLKYTFICALQNKLCFYSYCKNNYSTQ